MPNLNRNGLLLIYSTEDSAEAPKVIPSIKNYLLAAQQSNPSVCNYVVQELSDWNAENVPNTCALLTKARVVVVFEGPRLLSSSFVQSDDPSLLRLDTVREHGGAIVIRLPFRHVLPRLTPSFLTKIQFRERFSNPLSEFQDSNQLDLVLNGIIDMIVEEYTKWHPKNSDDEVNDLAPFQIDRSNLIQQIHIHPEPILSWLESQSLITEVLGTKFYNWIKGLRDDSESLKPVWNLPHVDMSNAAYTDEEIKTFARLEQQAARLYPRQRDAYHCLYSFVSDFRLSEFSLSLAEMTPGQFDRLDRMRQLVQTFPERKLHFEQVLLSLIRKVPPWWAALTRIEKTLQQKSNLLPTSYFLVWQCVPMCLLAVLHRSKVVSWNTKTCVSLSQSLLLLDRSCHWLKSSNRLLNSIDGVPQSTKMGDSKLWTS